MSGKYGLRSNEKVDNFDAEEEVQDNVGITTTVLKSIYLNPFNTQITLSFDVKDRIHVHLGIYNL